MNNQFFKIALYSIMAAGIISGCNHADSAEKKTTVTTTAPALETFALEKGDLATTLQLPGELIAFQQVDLYAKLTSYVKELKVDIGSQVSTGQLLMRLEAPELTSQLAGAESKLKSQEALYHASNATYNRLLETSKTPGTISQNDLDIAAARKNSDLAQLDAARAAYKEISVMRSYLEIRAPFSGIISARNVNLGAYVGPAGKGSELPLLTLQEQKHLRLAVAIPEVYAGYIQNGGNITFTVKSLPGRAFNASIKRMSGALDTKLRSLRVEMDIDNSNKQLLPGMVAEINVPLNGQDNTYIIPKTALINSDEGLYLIRVTNGVTEKIPVKKGREVDGKVEVFGTNLNIGDRFVKKASEEIRNGTPIKL